MATRIRRVDQTALESPEYWLSKAPDHVLACRGQGHRFPKIKSSRAPRGVKARRQRDGGYQVTFTCPDCGTERTLVTLPGGALEDAPRRYTYKYADDYRAPKGTSRTACFEETWHRVLEDLKVKGDADVIEMDERRELAK